MANGEHCVAVVDRFLEPDSPGACRGDCSSTTEQYDLAVMQPCAHHPKMPARVPRFTKNVKLLAKLWENQINLQRTMEISGFPNLLPSSQWLACEVCSYREKHKQVFIKRPRSNDTSKHAKMTSNSGEQQEGKDRLRRRLQVPNVNILPIARHN